MFVYVVSLYPSSSRDLDYPLWDVLYPMLHHVDLVGFIRKPWFAHLVAVLRRRIISTAAKLYPLQRNYIHCSEIISIAAKLYPLQRNYISKITNIYGLGNQTFKIASKARGYNLQEELCNVVNGYTLRTHISAGINVWGINFC